MTYTKAEQLKVGQWIRIASEPALVQVKSVQKKSSYNIQLIILEFQNIDGQTFEIAELLSKEYTLTEKPKGCHISKKIHQ
ncbi:MAG: hypothetical protein OXE55_04005 [Flavobacteriaceae bacterium]|nr:hypothetical protein [Flavobacteriaceae bacterium]MCY4253482.1 hypothetical protein [Flavobacteriaceae bacterium]